MVIDINDAIIRSFQSLYNAESFGICSLHTIYTFKDFMMCRFVDTQNSDVHRKKFNAFVSEELHLSAAPHKHPLGNKTTDSAVNGVSEASLLPHPNLAIHSWAIPEFIRAHLYQW